MSINTVEGAKAYKASVEESINKELESIKEYGKKLEKALKKEKWDDVRHNNSMIASCFKHKKQLEETLPECDFFIKRAEWIESGYGSIVEFLELVLNKDMEWYKAIKEQVSSMSQEEVRQAIKEKSLSGTEYSIAKMSEKEALSEFRKDVVSRFNNLIKRVEKKAGKIVDAQHLQINPKGELDGTIIGEEATVHVSTIGAGGHSIQRFHFRTLVK